jgi:hypothetical protein
MSVLPLYWPSGPDNPGLEQECHKAKNCVAVERKSEATPGEATGRLSSDTKTARAVIEIQRRLPRARVLYVSATGATDPENLCYMSARGEFLISWFSQEFRK